MPRRGWAVAVILVAVAMSVLDSGIASVALPAITRQLRTTPASALWVVNAYQLVTAAALLPCAALGEAAGFRRVFLGGLALFTAGSLACAISADLPMLIGTRIVQGLGAAAVMSLLAGFVRQIYPAAMLGRAIGSTALVVAASAAAAPAVATAIVSVASWPWLFAINVPAGAVTLALGATVLPHVEPRRAGFDVVAALLAMAATAFLFIGMDALGRRPGLGGLEVACAAATLLVLLARQRGQAAPMLPLDLLRVPVIGYAVGASVLCFAAQTLGQVSLPFHLQSALGRSQLEVGALMTPWPIGTALMAPIAGRLADRWPSAGLASLGAGLLGAGLLAMEVLPATTPSWAIAVCMLLCGLGFGFFQTPNNRSMLGAAPRARAGASGGLQATARLFGQTAGVTALALCLQASWANGAGHALLVGAALAAGSAVVNIGRLRLRRSP